mgnify:CR=1 FL=1
MDSAVSTERTNCQEALPPHAFLMPERNVKSPPNSYVSLRPGPLKFDSSINGDPVLHGDSVLARSRSATMDDISVTTSMFNIFDQEVQYFDHSMIFQYN